MISLVVLFSHFKIATFSGKLVLPNGVVLSRCKTRIAIRTIIAAS